MPTAASSPTWVRATRRRCLPPSPRQIQADFGGELRLDSYDRSPADPLPGELLQLTLHWQALTAVERRYTLYLHLIDRDGRTVTQVDEGILGGRYRPLFWPPETLVRDYHALPIPPDLPAGRYRLVTGLYDETPEQPVGRAVPLDFVWIGPLPQPPAPEPYALRRLWSTGYACSATTWCPLRKANGDSRCTGKRRNRSPRISPCLPTWSGRAGRSGASTTRHRVEGSSPPRSGCRAITLPMSTTSPCATTRLPAPTI